MAHGGKDQHKAHNGGQQYAAQQHHVFHPLPGEEQHQGGDDLGQQEHPRRRPAQ